MWFKKDLIALLLLLCVVSAYSQDKHVLNSAGTYTSKQDFEVISNFAEPVASRSQNIDNGFLVLGSLEKFYEEDVLVIYPNPANEGIFIELGLDSDVAIYSRIGQLVYSARLTKGLRYIDLSTLAEGVYFIRVVNTSLEIKGYKLLKI